VVKKYILPALLVLAFSVSAAHAEDDLQSRTEAAKRYVTTMDLDSQIDTIANSIVNSVAAKANPPATPDQKKEFSIFAHDAIDKEAYRKSIVDLLTNVYTTEELNALADFHSSAIGQSIAKKSTKYSTNLITVTIPIIIKTLKSYKDYCLGRSDCIKMSDTPPAAAPNAGKTY
jgi:hypothetical protein